MGFIKLTTLYDDSKGPIYIYVEVNSIVAVSAYNDSTSIFLSNGQSKVVKESPTEIFEKIDKLTALKLLGRGFYEQ